MYQGASSGDAPAVAGLSPSFTPRARSRLQSLVALTFGNYVSTFADLVLLRISLPVMRSSPTRMTSRRSMVSSTRPTAP